MRVPPVYGSPSDMFLLQNSYLSNSYPQVGGECEIHPYTEARQTCIHEKLIIQIMIDPN